MPSPQTLEQVRCPQCGAWLFSAAGDGTVIEIRCRCKRTIRIEDIKAPRAV